MTKTSQLPPISDADLSRVTGAGLPSLWSLPLIAIGYAFSPRSDKTQK